MLLMKDTQYEQVTVSILSKSNTTIKNVDRRKEKIWRKIKNKL